MYTTIIWFVFSLDASRAGIRQHPVQRCGQPRRIPSQRQFNISKVTEQTILILKELKPDCLAPQTSLPTTTLCALLLRTTSGRTREPLETLLRLQILLRAHRFRIQHELPSRLGPVILKLLLVPVHSLKLLHNHNNNSLFVLAQKRPLLIRTVPPLARHRFRLLRCSLNSPLNHSNHLYQRH